MSFRPRGGPGSALIFYVILAKSPSLGPPFPHLNCGGLTIHDDLLEPGALGQLALGQDTALPTRISKFLSR
jgi:hypothetical protein